MKMCCRNCQHCNKLWRYDYSNIGENGVVHREMGGYACTGFCGYDEDSVIHMVGLDIDNAKCELFEERRDGKATV